MVQIRPVTDLQNKYNEIEDIITTSSSPVFLTKNGYGSFVIMSMRTYNDIIDNTEQRLDEADIQAEQTNLRFSHSEVFDSLKQQLRSEIL